MINPTDSQPFSNPRLLGAEAHRVVWREIPRRPEVEAEEREPWYDLAARYEEPERWDGMA